MRRKICIVWLSLVLPLFLLLGACVPATGSYYRITSSDGTTRGYCSDLGPPVAVQLKRGSVNVVVGDIRDPIKPYMSQKWFSVDIFTSPNDTVEFLSDHLKVIDDADGNEVPVQVHLMTGANRPGAAQRIEVKSEFDGNEYNDYTIEYVFVGQLGHKFHIEFPEVQVNRVKYPGTHIEYAQDSGTFIRC